MTQNNKPPRVNAGAAPGEDSAHAGSGAEHGAVIVYATFPDRAAALACGRAMVEARLAGCINVLPAMTSVYVWNGQTEEADEAVLLAKLPAEGAQRAVAFIKSQHTYDVPAILVLPVTAGFAPYLAWLRQGTDPV